MRRLLWLAVLASCTHRASFGDPDPKPDADPNHPFPPPRTDVVPAIGSEGTLEIATWNIENFPGAPGTPEVVADLIASMDLDIVVCEEIADEGSWNELLLRLRDHEGVLSTHVYTPTEYQKIGVIYRSSLVTAGAPQLLFTSDEFTFPRPPLSLPVTIDGETIELIGVHLKAGVAFEDAERRRAAIAALDNRLRAQVDGGGEADVVLLGDYNERVITEPDRAVLAPLLTAPDRYTVRTEPAALDGAASFLGFGGTFIDHITTTAALDARWTLAAIRVPELHVTVERYRSEVSDHLPVVLIVPR